MTFKVGMTLYDSGCKCTQKDMSNQVTMGLGDTPWPAECPNTPICNIDDAGYQVDLCSTLGESVCGDHWEGGEVGSTCWKQCKWVDSGTVPGACVAKSGGFYKKCHF
jgi:hypothetical protein